MFGHRKLKPRKRGQGTATQKRRKQLRLDKVTCAALCSAMHLCKSICYVDLLIHRCAVDGSYGRGFPTLQALGVADKKSTKAIKLSTAKQRKQHAKGLWSKAE